MPRELQDLELVGVELPIIVADQQRPDGDAYRDPKLEALWWSLFGRRCLVVTDGFYEWKKLDTAGKQKQPYAVALGNRGPMVMAGLWEPWNSPDGLIRSCTIITADANELVAKVHNRVPAIVAPDDYA
jgi:putative SOS response-associated peptidase YedK